MNTGRFGIVTVFQRTEEMAVFFSPHSDIILSALCIALLWTGMNCIALAKEKNIARPVPSWLFLGVAMLILAAREWIGIIGVSESGFISGYPVAAIMQTVASLFILIAADRESAPRSKTAIFVHLLTGVLLLVLLGLIAQPFLDYDHALAGGEALITSSVFFLAKISLCLVCAIFFACALHHSRPPTGGFRLVLALFFIHALVIALCNPPGTPANPAAFDPAANDAMLGLWLFRVCVAFSMAVLTWNLYARTLGVVRRIRWWPALLLGIMLAVGFAFVLASAESYANVMRRSLVATAENAAAAIPEDALLAAASAAGSANRPETADALFARVRRMAGFQGYSDFTVQLDAIAVRPGENRPVPVIDIKSNADGGKWVAVLHPLDAAWEKVKASPGFFTDESGFHTLGTVIAAAPITRADSTVLGASVLSVDAADLVRDMHVFKRPLLLVLPLAFFLSLLLIAGQQRSWLASHSSNRAEALRMGALSRDLAGIMVTTNVGLQSRVLDANQRLLDILGLKREELIGRTTETAFTFVSRRAGADGGTTSSTAEISFRRPDGRLVHLMVFGRPLSDSPDDHTHVWESVDITRIREMENEVRRSHDHLQMILDTLPEAVFVKDAEGRFTMVNKAFNTLLCLGPEETPVGKRFDEIDTVKGGNAAINDDICRDMRGKTLVYDQALTFGNTTKFFGISKTMRRIGDGEDDFVIVGSIHDLTQRKKIGDAIDAERHFLHQVLNTLPVAVCFIDRDRVVRICDDDFRREAGFDDASDIIGKQFDDVSPFGPSDREDDENLLACGAGNTDTAFELAGGSGRARRHFTLRRTVMSSPEGEVLGLVKAYWDTTALVSANRAAQQAERAKMAFLSNMSHELRTPMNGIVGMADLIIDHKSTEPMQRLHAETIIRSAKTLQMVMDEVMDVATMQEGSHRFAVNPAPFPLMSLAEESAQIVSCIVEAWGVDLSLNYDLNLQTMYNGDARHLRQILVQILTHTSRLTRDKRLRLEVSGVGSLEDEHVSFRVVFKPSDGVDTQYIEDMFKHRDHAGDETKSAINLGIFNDRIGLPLTWRLIEAMGGSLSVTRQFRDIRCEVVLPLAGQQGPNPITAPDLSGARVLVGTNIPERALVAKKYFEYAHADVYHAETADMVRYRLRAAKEKGRMYDLLVLDGSLTHLDDLPGLVAEVRKFYEGGKKEPDIMLVVSSRQVQNLQLEAHAVKCLLLPPICPSELWYKADALVGGTLPEPAKMRRRSTRAKRIVKIPAKVLLVEDNSVNQMVAMGILKRIGCQPTLAKDGSEAVEMVVEQKLQFDLILMDCMMPEMDGYEATMHIRLYEKANPDAKRNTVVALTANSLAGDRERCLASGMDDYMTKPVTLDQVRDCLLKHCTSLILAIDNAEEAAG